LVIPSQFKAGMPVRTPWKMLTRILVF